MSVFGTSHLSRSLDVILEYNKLFYFDISRTRLDFTAGKGLSKAHFTHFAPTDFEATLRPVVLHDNYNTQTALHESLCPNDF